MGDIWIGIDTGGTFTDLVLVDRDTGRTAYHKLPTSSAEPASAILEGIRAILDGAGETPGGVSLVVHGTTLGTNAVLEGKCAPTGMITTQGFRDVLELARQRRPHFFDLDIPKPTPPVSRDRRLEVAERVDHDGTVVTPLDETGLRAAVATLRAAGVEAVALCFLHSYANPAHERRARDVLREAWPEAYCCASSDVLAEFREFERFSTATLNAALMPVMDRYLERFESGVRDLGVAARPQVMQSNGGAVSTDAIRRAPVNTFFSGPAGGVIGSMGLGDQLGLPDLITFDMGGTSTDVCLIADGEPAKKNVRDIAGFPVRTRTIDLHTIGAGGGSIAWVDPGGLLKVGPQSAGAVPGPATYGRGGTEPTVTDANVVLGRLGGRNRLAGTMTLDTGLAATAVGGLAARLGMDPVDAAAGIVEIVNANMMGAVRVISVERGHDPRGFTLVAFGGAGPLHGADVAAAMGIGQVLVPQRPGLLSAIGLLHADLRGDFSLTRLVAATDDAAPAVNGALAELRGRGEAWLRAERQDRAGAGDWASAEFSWFVDMRYLGQSFELMLPLGTTEVDAAAISRLRERFHEAHRGAYGYDLPAQPIEIVALRLVVGAERPHPRPDAPPAVAGGVEAARVETRPVWFPGAGFVDTAVYNRARLPTDAGLDGPLIVEQMDTTTVVPPDARCRIDGLGNILITLAPAAAAPARAAAVREAAR